MAKILVLTKIYPSNDIEDGDTKVVHYFAKKWVELGHEVVVVQSLIVFPSIITKPISWFRNWLTAKLGAVIPIYDKHDIEEYVYDSVPVIRIPVVKYIPHHQLSKEIINKEYKEIVDRLSKRNFNPDVIVGHWWNPQLELLHLLKPVYKSKTCLVFHDVDESKKNNAYSRYLPSIDIFGARSIPLKYKFESIFGDEYKTFFCYSGVPEKYILGSTAKIPCANKKRLTITYVGTLIKRKNPISILEALNSVRGDAEYIVNFIGTGAERVALENYSKSLSNNIHVNLWGKVSRDKVSEILSNTDIFVMISQGEAFGLVYLEAMGAGCITIASKNEGMDGIIEDGVNGFLCKAGDSTELQLIFEKIASLSMESIKTISQNAIKTANLYSDTNAATNYINNALNV